MSRVGRAVYINWDSTVNALISRQPAWRAPSRPPIGYASRATPRFQVYPAPASFPCSAMATSGRLSFTVRRLLIYRSRMRSTCGRGSRSHSALRPAPAPPGWNPSAATTLRVSRGLGAGGGGGSERAQESSPRLMRGWEVETPAQGLIFSVLDPQTPSSWKSLCQLAHLESRSLGLAPTPGIWVSVSRLRIFKYIRRHP